MLKRDELANPNSCWNKAGEEELVFVLLGRDSAAPATIRYWIEQRIALGLNHFTDPQIQDAIALAFRLSGGTPHRED